MDLLATGHTDGDEHGSVMPMTRASSQRLLNGDSFVRPADPEIDRACAAPPLRPDLQAGTWNMRIRFQLLFLALLVVACAGGPSISPSTQDPAASGDPAFLPTIVSSELAKGPTRFLFSLTDRENRLLASPDLKVSLDFYDADSAPEAVVFQEVARFIWAVEGERGLYVADVDFPDFGRWAARFEATLPDGQIESVRVEFDVLEETRTPSVG